METNSIFVVKVKVAELHGVPANRNVWDLQLDLLVNKNVVAA